jgi:hypothetical protein
MKTKYQLYEQTIERWLESQKDDNYETICQTVIEKYSEEGIQAAVDYISKLKPVQFFLGEGYEYPYAGTNTIIGLKVWMRDGEKPVIISWENVIRFIFLFEDNSRMFKRFRY